MQGQTRKLTRPRSLRRLLWRGSARWHPTPSRSPARETQGAGAAGAEQQGRASGSAARAARKAAAGPAVVTAGGAQRQRQREPGTGQAAPGTVAFPFQCINTMHRMTARKQPHTITSFLLTCDSNSRSRSGCGGPGLLLLGLLPSPAGLLSRAATSQQRTCSERQKVQTVCTKGMGAGQRPHASAPANHPIEILLLHAAAVDGWPTRPQRRTSLSALLAASMGACGEAAMRRYGASGEGLGSTGPSALPPWVQVCSAAGVQATRSSPAAPAHATCCTGCGRGPRRRSSRPSPSSTCTHLRQATAGAGARVGCNYERRQARMPQAAAAPPTRRLRPPLL